MASILRQTTVVRDGFHNAFTDLQFWQNNYWISYRKGSGHLILDGTATLSCSSDRVRFREVASIKVPGDVRDPKLVPINDRCLGMILTTWDGAYEISRLKSYITFSEDGFNWEKPQRILHDGQMMWRIRKHNGLFYGLVKNRYLEMTPPGTDIHLMTSENLIDWTLRCKIGEPEHALDESDIFFHDNGDVWVVARSTCKPGLAYFCAGNMKFKKWEMTQLDNVIHAPIMLEHQGRIYLAGRYKPALGGYSAFPSENSLGIWELTPGKAELVMHIPAIGDCSYPGFIKDNHGRICMSYYSYHAYMMGVLAPSIDQPELHACDVYFAELQLP